ncbi:hypothetical protein [Halomonas elongata]|uniref:Uncharacterized protein n=1 Tax=Halomonas elongata (strain ATCC 33173 / DSM 2581 / NBRC 15536 / NCIMB 2198 / 1H9) TaxID=768066 RepID=E1VAE6_HALED|nr:hypothetical protein [Halomonas elongata]WBF19252.1 hypothetical protein LM502_06055 [Halomonas elongata]WPU48112.1 hypothetical protein SR933_04280 [Halomonas elongata DSM 2581]CBV41992.1 uncharacterized protein HELO_2108 [Halomonas elongata DSM 2581]
MGNAAEQLQNAPQPYAAELVELDNAEQQLADLKSKYGTVPDYSTKDGYKTGKQAIQALTKMRTATDKARLAITKPHRDFIEKVNQRAKGLIGEVEQLEAPHREAKREVDEAEQRAKEERIARLRERLSKEVTSYLDTAEGLDSTSLAGLIDEAEAIDTEGYFDVTKEAEDEKARVLATLRERHAAALERERLAAEREEIERERAELERLRAAQAQAEMPAPAPGDVASAGGTVFSQEDSADWDGLDNALQDVPAADPFGEALEDLQSAGLDASQAVDVLSAIQRGDIRHVSLQQ